jgi:quinohemoprotein ethanol dehydrogenase
MRMIRVVALLFALSACQDELAQPAPPSARAEGGAFGALDAARLARADQEPGNWPTTGRDGNGSHFSPLTQINAKTIERLGVAWDTPLETQRGLQATPVVIDGVMFTSGNWGRVYALDAGTGEEIWTYDPQPDPQWARHACCDIVNRGIAVWQGRIYVGAIDGFLHAIDAKTGVGVWKIDTLSREARAAQTPYTITGAPIIAGDAVIIGNGGADFGVRGYVSAYDLATGARKWIFYTVPRDPGFGKQDQPHLEKAISTWDPNSDWGQGGGGTVWDGMAYDPKLDLLYIGTGNASPYSIKDRSPRGGDNLFAASVVAIRAKTGAYVWHFQQVPGENWDYTSTQKMVLADLKIGGTSRAVLLHAPKNGFYYVLDRATGAFLFAKPFVYVNWTKGLDPKTGRPRPNPAFADYTGGPRLIYPPMSGAHNWHPMSFSPRRGLVYVPTIEAPMVYIDTSARPAGLVEGTFTTVGLFPEGYDPQALRGLFGDLPPLETLAKSAGVPFAKSLGVLTAIDAATGRIVWRQKTHSFWDGGVLSTAGDLVFQGDAAGFLNIYHAKSGKRLRRIEIGTSIMAAPMSYSVGNTQYIAFMAGYGGGGGFYFPPDSAAYQRGNQGRIIAFKLGGGPVAVPEKQIEEPLPKPPPRIALASGAQSLAQGEVLYNRYCARCHMFGRGLVPDLRRMAPETHAEFYDILLKGARLDAGMARFDDVLKPADARAIHAYLIDQAWQAQTQN